MPLHEEHKKRRGRNWAMFFVLVGLVALFFWLTMSKMTAATGVAP